MPGRVKIKGLQQLSQQLDRGHQAQEAHKAAAAVGQMPGRVKIKGLQQLEQQGWGHGTELDLSKGRGWFFNF